MGRARFVGCLLACLSGPITSQAQTAPSDSLVWWGPETLAVATDSLRLAPQQVRVDLRHGFIADLVNVHLNDRQLALGEEITLDRIGGLLLLAQPAAGGEMLRVTYRYEPASLTRRIELHRPLRQPLVGDSPEARPRVSGPVAATDVDGLNISGSKSVSVQGGSNREATVDQALRLSVSGKLSPGIGVRAEISDENLPITPEGNTEELSDLDQVRIELFGARGGAVLGDFALESEWGSFAPVRRKLQGIWVRGRSEAGAAAVLAGAPRGRRVEVELLGREGVQGPYELLDGQRLQQSFIVAGTERVWLNGQRLERGENRDYIMDYVRGTIRFTETRPISPDSRIAVDFETSESSYRQSLAGARVDSLSLGPVRMQASVLREADDVDRPTDGALGADDRDRLAEAGDQSDLALGSGVTPRPEQDGRYFERDEGGVTFYEYAPDGDGDFDVNFVRVASGDYRRDGVDPEGNPIFLYVGPGQGEYAVGRALGLPERTSLGVLRFDLGEAQRYLRAELDVSDHDRNTLSARDDDDNQGLAYRVEGSSGWMGGDDEGLRISSQLELLGENFVSLGRLRTPFFYEAWNLQDDVRDRAEDRQSSTLEWLQGERRAEVGVERLHRRDQFTGRRLRTSGSGRVWGRVGWSHRVAYLDATRDGGQVSDRRDRSVSLQAREGRFRPRVSVFDESFTDRRPASQRGFRSAGWSTGVATGHEGATIDLGFRRDVADSLSTDDRWQFARDARQWTGRARATRPGLSLDLDVSWREAKLPQGRDQTTRLVRARVSRRPLDSWWGGDVEYRAGTDASRLLEREVIFVGLGEGDYDAEGNLVGTRQGDYNVVFTPSDSLVQATEVEFRTSLDFRPNVSLAGGVASQTLWQVRERNRGDDVAAVLRLDPAVLLDEDGTVFGERRLREELQLLRRVQGLDLRVTFEDHVTLDQRFVGGTERSHRRTRQARLEAQVQRGLVVRVLAGDEDRDRGAPPSPNPLLASYRVRDRFGSVTGRWQLSARTRTSLELRATDRQETRDNIAQTVLEARPSATLDWLQGRWTVDLRWAEVSEESIGDPLRPVFFERPGTVRSGAVSTQWSLGSNFTVLLRYQVRDDPDRPLRQDLGVETRARF